MKSQRNILSEASVVDSGAVEDSLRSAPALLDIYLNWAWTLRSLEVPLCLFSKKSLIFAALSHMSAVGLELLSLWTDSHFH